MESNLSLTIEPDLAEARNCSALPESFPGKWAKEGCTDCFHHREPKPERLVAHGVQKKAVVLWGEHMGDNQ